MLRRHTREAVHVSHSFTSRTSSNTNRDDVPVLRRSTRFRHDDENDDSDVATYVTARRSASAD